MAPLPRARHPHRPPCRRWPADFTYPISQAPYLTRYCIHEQAVPTRPPRAGTGVRGPGWSGELGACGCGAVYGLSIASIYAPPPGCAPGSDGRRRWPLPVLRVLYPVLYVYPRLTPAMSLIARRTRSMIHEPHVPCICMCDVVVGMTVDGMCIRMHGACRHSTTSTARRSRLSVSRRHSVTLLPPPPTYIYA